MIITVANAKGGTGKSAIAYLIAHHLRENKKNVVCVDSDTTQFSFRLSMTPTQNLNDEPVVEFKKLGSLVKNKTNYEKNYVVIDTSPSLTEETKTAIKIADLVIIPTILVAPIVKQTFDFCKLLQDNGICYIIVPNLALSPSNETTLQKQALCLLSDNKTTHNIYDGVIYQSENLRKNIANAEPNWSKGLLLDQRQNISKFLSSMIK